MTRLWLTGEPIRAEVDANGLPIAFTWQGRTHPVEQVVARWRVDLFWWRGRIRRDYFKVITTSGLLAVIYRDVSRESWHIQRVYD